MVDFTPKEHYTAQDLVEIVALLRAPEGGCPWDKEQTHQSIRMNFIEETYEAVDAIDLEDPHLLEEELGDVLLQVALHSQMEAEVGRFDFNQVCDGICKKLVYRHPHVFGDVSAASSGQALTNWEMLKNAEKGRSTAQDRLESVPRSFPALMRAAKLQKRAAAYGFELTAAQALEQISACTKQLAKPQPDTAQAGQLLFAAAALCRSLGLDPEQALTQASDAFQQQVIFCEQQAQAQGIGLEQATPQQRADWMQGQSIQQSAKE